MHRSLHPSAIWNGVQSSLKIGASPTTSVVQQSKTYLAVETRTPKPHFKTVDCQSGVLSLLSSEQFVRFYYYRDYAVKDALCMQNMGRL